MRTRCILALVVLFGALLAFASAAVLVSAGVQTGGEFSASPSMSISASSERTVIPDRQKLLPSAGPAQSTAAPAAAIMPQNFEGAWPAPGWQLLDKSSQDGGEYLFGKRNCHPWTGSYAGWSVGGGAQGSALACSANFPDEADTSAT